MHFSSIGDAGSFISKIYILSMLLKYDYVFNVFFIEFSEIQLRRSKHIKTRKKVIEA